MDLVGRAHLSWSMKQRSEEVEAVERRQRASGLARGEFIAEEVLRDLAALKAECAGHGDTVRDPAF